MLKKIFNLCMLIIVYFVLFCAIPAVFFWEKTDRDFWALMFISQLIGSGFNIAIMAETHSKWCKNIWMYLLLVIVALPWIFLVGVLFSTIGYSFIVSSFTFLGLANFLKWCLIILSGGFAVILILCGYNYMMQKVITDE